MQIIPFEPPHLRAVAPQCAQSDFTAYVETLDMHALVQRDAAFTAIDDAEGGRAVLGCAGVVTLWPGVGQAWAIFSDRLLGHPVALTRATGRALDRISATQDLRRVQATVRDGHGAGARWLSFLGFELEGLLVNYGPGGSGDYWMYGRTI
tara:strand:- start:167386 stop:167835 length:450 start_codon:yes stop_codon:yes gene_type:complete